jgi:hypothetical protein
MIDKIYYQP